MNICAKESTLVTRVERLPLFAGLSKAETERLLRRLHAHSQSFPARAFIPNVMGMAHIVLSGRVDVRGFGLKPEDRHLVCIAGVGAILHLGNVFPDLGGAEDELQMRTAGDVLTIDAAALYDLWLNGTVPAFSARLMALVGREIRQLRERIAVLSCYETGDRILLHLAHHAAKDHSVCYPGLAELAEILAVNRTALYRTATKLVAAGLVSQINGRLLLKSSSKVCKMLRGPHSVSHMRHCKSLEGDNISDRML